MCGYRSSYIARSCKCFSPLLKLGLSLKNSYQTLLKREELKPHDVLFKLGLILTNPAGVPRLFASLQCDVAHNIACLAKQTNKQTDKRKGVDLFTKFTLIFCRRLNESLHRLVNKTSPENLDEAKLVLGISSSLTNKALTR